jgi:hypothetical protein
MTKILLQFLFPSNRNISGLKANISLRCGTLKVCFLVVTLLQNNFLLKFKSVALWETFSMLSVSETKPLFVMKF